MLIYLVGFMGSGKSSNGRKLAKKLNYGFLDLDEMIKTHEGKSISEIFTEKGESYFREAERDCLSETFSLQNTVIATGGGSPCFYDNMARINAHGISIYLKMSPFSLYFRLKNSKTERPLLHNKTKEEMLSYIESKLSEREKYYMKSEIVIKAENLDLNLLRDTILQNINRESH